MDPNTFQNILQILEAATAAAALAAPHTGDAAQDVAKGAKIAAALESIVANAFAAHQSAVGSPMDTSKLHSIDLVQ
jgi:hypothetical protein